ncbi:hypothetical protein BDR04DRAFT_458776 [Suillus decipiens]|nr:hypothetical protein BDR04DRAFT_458776 [Suillus decipiens]
MSITETEDTSFKTVFLTNLVAYNPIKPIWKKKKTQEKVNKLKECLLHMEKQSIKSPKKRLMASSTSTLYQSLKRMQLMSIMRQISQTTSSRRNSTKRLLVTEPCTISWVRIGRIDHHVPRTKGLD